MPQPTWQVGAFAARYPRAAQNIGRALKEQAAAMRLLYATAGVTADSAITDSAYGYISGPPYDPGMPPRGCCGSPPCPAGQGIDSCCSRGTCACQEGDDDFAAMYPEVVAELDGQTAFGAAVRDILTDPDVEDVGAAVDVSRSMADKDQLAAFYIPTVPAKPLPNGEDAPARCPICGATQCAACGCFCTCLMSTHPEDEPVEDAGE